MTPESDVFPSEDPDEKIGFLLWNIERYRDMDMTQRTNVGMHSIRTAHLAYMLCNKLNHTRGLAIDRNRAFGMALHHDDPEIFTGDILFDEKRQFDGIRKLNLYMQEDEAVLSISQGSGMSRDEQIKYVERYIEYRERQTLESHVVKVADVWDSLGELIHEARCGNVEALLKIDKSSDALKGLYQNSPLGLYLRNDDTLGEDVLPHAKDIKVTDPLSIEDVNSPKRFFEVIRYFYQLPDSPRCYKDWLVFSANINPENPEVYLFPAWAEDLNFTNMEEYLKSNSRSLNYNSQEVE